MGFTDALRYDFLYGLPLWQVGLLLSFFFLAAEEIGFRVGLRHRHHSGVKDAESGGGGLVQTSLFAVLGLILAFTYSSAVDRHEGRRQGVVAEANALGTAYLRADIISEPTRGELKRALYNYAATRLPLHEFPSQEQREEELRITLAAQKEIWPIARRAVKSEQCGPVAVSLLNSINDIIDQHTNRMDAITHKLPAPALYFLILISVMSLAITGFNGGVQGHFSRWRSYSFALLLACLLLIIMDFDRPVDGLIITEQASMKAAIADMRADLSL